MRKRLQSKCCQTFYNPVFLGALVVLILNDHVFKALFHNFLTGKLSDFAGLFCFALFWMGIWPKHAKGILYMIGLSFMFWKSDYSTIWLNWLNQINILHFQRVVDYEDLWALVVLPMAYHYHHRIRNDTTQMRIRLSPVFPMLLASIAFVATSLEEVNPVCYQEFAYELPFSRMTLRDKMRDNFYTDTSPFQPGSDSLLLEYRTSICGDSSRILVIVRTVFRSDTTSILEVPELCTECDVDQEEDEVILDFEERVVKTLIDD